MQWNKKLSSRKCPILIYFFKKKITTVHATKPLTQNIIIIVSDIPNRSINEEHRTIKDLVLLNLKIGSHQSLNSSKIHFFCDYNLSNFNIPVPISYKIFITTRILWSKLLGGFKSTKIFFTKNWFKLMKYLNDFRYAYIPVDRR